MMFDFRHPVVFQTDASFLGYGAVCSDDWFAGAWAPSSLVDYNMSLYPHNWCTAGHAIDHSLRSNINFLELFPVILAARRWGSRWSNKRVCVKTDNTQAMTFINKGYCKNPLAMSWLRELFWLSVRYNFHLFSRHLPGQHNFRRQVKSLTILVSALMSLIRLVLGVSVAA